MWRLILNLKYYVARPEICKTKNKVFQMSTNEKCIKIIAGERARYFQWHLKRSFKTFLLSKQTHISLSHTIFYETRYKSLSLNFLHSSRCSSDFYLTQGSEQNQSLDTWSVIEIFCNVSHLVLVCLLFCIFNNKPRRNELVLGQ